LSLAVLTGLTPPEYEVRTVEEEFEKLPLDERWDIVGITTMTATSPRAYELAALFRQSGARVILGGIHPSVLPDEAAQFADAVLVGEAEGIWQQVLHDARRNQLERIYRNPQPDISESPVPVRKKRRSLLGFPPYVMPIMGTRGCPHQCEFCCVHVVYGRKERHIPVESIVKDIRSSGARRLMFLDDNIGGVRSYAMSLFSALEPLKVRWLGQATMRLILDRELFDAAVRSGVGGLFIGVESIEEEAARTMHKLPATELYEEAIRRCRAAGVVFHASFIFGLDEQTPSVFERTLDFIMRNSIPSVSANILTPYPGTRLFERLLRERRVLHTNWAYYDHTTVCYQPKNMSPEELAEKYLDFRHKLFSWASIVRRSHAQWRVAPFMYLGMNLAYRRGTKPLERHFADYFRWLGERKRVARLEYAP
jgi:radical SAM superfamily enzyme YgiQ (UPF0313 family)